MQKKILLQASVFLNSKLKFIFNVIYEYDYYQYDSLTFRHKTAKFNVICGQL